MPSNRRRTRQAQPEIPERNDPIAAPEQTPEGGSGPVEGTGQAAGETPAPAAEGAGQEGQGQNAAEAAVEGQGADGTPAPAEEGQAAADGPAPAEPQTGLPMTVQLRTGIPAEDVAATADVTLGDLCTIRNVKIKTDDYGFKVVMPRTKMPDTGRFKDACYFHTPELREQFDAAVKEAYRQTLEPAQEQGGMGGMTM